MNTADSLLGESGSPALPFPAAVFLRYSGSDGIELMPRGSAEALLEQVTASPMHDVTGDLSRGFACPVPGAHPRRSHEVAPLAAPVWPNSVHPTAVAVELWWAPDQDGRRLVRSFVAWIDSPYNAYLIACCLWSTASTGAHAEAAFLYGPDRRVAYQIKAAAWTCSNVPAETIARALATASDRFSTRPLPDARTSALQEERLDRSLTRSSANEVIITARRWERRKGPAEHPVEVLGDRSRLADAGSVDRDPGNRRASRREQLEVAASCTP